MLKQAIQTAVAAVAAASHAHVVLVAHVAHVIHAETNVVQYAVRNVILADAAAISHTQAIPAQITISAQTTTAAQM